MKMPLQRHGVNRRGATRGHIVEIGIVPMADATKQLIDFSIPKYETKSLRPCEVKCGMIPDEEAKNTCLAICRKMGVWREGL